MGWMRGDRRSRLYRRKERRVLSAEEVRIVVPSGDLGRLVNMKVGMGVGRGVPLGAFKVVALYGCDMVRGGGVAR